MTYFYKAFGYSMGKKHFRATPYWLPSVIAYGASAVILTFWLTDYRVVMKKVPWYNQRFLYPYEDDKNLYFEPRFTLDEKDNA